MIRKNIQVTKKQEELLKKEAFENRISEAKVVRKALDLYFKNQKEENKMKKSYYETDGSGSYFEFELKDGSSGLIDTAAGIREVPKEMEGMSIVEIVEEYGEGEILEEPMNPEKREENKMFFDNLFDYVRDSEIGNYKWSCSQPEGKEILVQEIDVLEDPNLFLDRDREIEKNGNTYISINWGEDENCYILESEIGQYAGRFWTVAFWKDDITIQSYGNIYRTKEDAIVAAKGNYEVTEDEILVNEIN